MIGPPARPADGGAMLGPLGEVAAAREATACPNCGQPLDAAARFCEACGTQIGDPSAELGQPREDEKPRAWFPLLLAGWFLIMVAALYFVYASAITLGST
jgi:predicted amidophosphoribosyltransferase